MTSLSLEQIRKLDLLALVSSELFDMDVRCQLPSLYKYLNFSDPVFLQTYLPRPTIKFATKAQLNDPFDLSRRFESFGAEPVRAFFKKHVLAGLIERLGDPSYISDELAKDARFALSGLTRGQLHQMLLSPIGQSYISMAREDAERQVPAMIDLLFEVADFRLDELMEPAISKTGVLSLSELPDNRALWSVYADAGRGLVLEMNAQHSFFLAVQKDGTTRNRLMKVAYRNDRLPDLWTNPFYLFGVKHADFVFEQEWRAIRSLQDCVPTTLGSGDVIHTMDAPIGLISSIIFGHRWSTAEIEKQGNAIRAFDPAIAIKRAMPSPQSGNYIIRDTDLGADAPQEQ